MQDEEYQEVLARAKKDAEKYGMKLNPDEKIVGVLIKGLIKNKHAAGEYYCPCKLAHTENNICMCKEAREKNVCKCGLFVKQ